MANETFYSKKLHVSEKGDGKIEMRYISRSLLKNRIDNKNNKTFHIIIKMPFEKLKTCIEENLHFNISDNLLWKKILTC